MNEKEIEILMEINRKMVDIQIEKETKYRTTWKICDLTFLRTKLTQKTQKLFLCETIEKELRELTHVFNYAFFLYYRLKELYKELTKYD